MKTLGSRHPRPPRVRELVNTLKTEIETAIEDKRARSETARPPAGAVDVTLPGRRIPIGQSIR